MRAVSLALTCFVIVVVLGQAGEAEGGKTQIHFWREGLEDFRVREKMAEAPATLAEAHAELERMLSPEALAKVDAMTSEDDARMLHLVLGGDILEGWKLRRDSVLAKHMEKLGFARASDMSDAIVDTFWCKRHGQDFRLAERAAESRKQWEADQKAREESEKRKRETRGAVRSRMMGLQFEQQDVPKVSIALRNESGLRVRSLCPFRDGVFLTAFHRGSLHPAHIIMQESYTDPNGDGRPMSEYNDFVHRGHCLDRTTGKVRKMKPGEDFYTQGYYFDPADCKIHRIGVPEIDEVYAAAVAGERAWFGGLTDGKLVVTGVGAQDRITVSLPQEDEMPDLGVDGQSLLAVYSRTIYRLEDRTWTVVHSGDILLPRSSLPPLRHGNTVFFREEGQMRERRERLWWLTMTEPVHLGVLDRDLRVPYMTGVWLNEVTSYCVTSGGDLWVCASKYWASNCLLRRTMDGSYSIATFAGSVRFMEGWLKTSLNKYEGAGVYAVRALPDDTLLLAGRTGLYRLKGDDLVQELAFALDRPSKWVKERDRVVTHVTWRRQGDKMVKEVTDVVQKAPEKGRQVFSSVPWLPNSVLQLKDGSYFLGTDTWEGAYWFRQDDSGQWTCLPANEGDPVVW